MTGQRLGIEDDSPFLQLFCVRLFVFSYLSLG